MTFFMFFADVVIAAKVKGDFKDTKQEGK